MSANDRVETLRRLLQERFADVTMAIDPPSRPNGDWFIDVRLGDQTLVVEFRPSLGFGLSSTPGESLGEGPDEFLDDESGVVDRISELVTRRARTEPQRVRILQELRERRRVSQVTLAAMLGVRQPTVSKLERREDINLSTLRRYVKALGGKLHVTAEFPDGAVEISTPSQPGERLSSGG